MPGLVQDAAANAGDAIGAAARRRVWDPLVRAVHIGLIASAATAWLTPDGGIVHETAGYAFLALAALRVAWGFVGPPKARFGTFVRGMGTTLGYARAVWRRREPRHLGHNPLGGWMIVALLGTGVLAAATGWLYTTDRFWGVAWVERIHHILADTFLVLAVLHVAGVIFTSVRQRENLPASMVHGRKEVRPGDVD